MRIDVHAHYWSKEYLDILESYGKDTSVQRDVGAGGGEELVKRLEMMDEAGIVMQTLSASPLLPYFENRQHALHAATYVNDEYAALVRQYPNRFRAFAALPFPHVQDAMDELRRALDKLKMIGVTMTTSVLERTVADPAWTVIFEELNRRGSVLYIHPSGCGAASPFIHDHQLTWMVGAPVEDTLAAMHLFQKGIPGRYPRIKIILSHLGGPLSTLLQRIDHLYEWEWNLAPGVLEKPSVTAKRMWYDTVSHIDPIALIAARTAFGASQLVLGTDFPYQNDYFLEAVNYVKDVLSQEEADAILDKNLAQLLGLGT